MKPRRENGDGCQPDDIECQQRSGAHDWFSSKLSGERIQQTIRAQCKSPVCEIDRHNRPRRGDQVFK
jgi:hypothetical protein